MPTSTTRRTTAKAPAGVVDFDAARKKKKKGPATKKIRAFGKDWQTQQANVTYLVDFEEEQSAPNMLAFILAHIVKAERVAFTEALRDEEGMGIEEIFELMRSVEAAAYPEIPSTPS